MGVAIPNIQGNPHRRSITILCLIGFLIAYFTWHYVSFLSTGNLGGLDSSWILGLNWASATGLHWSGSNLVFTYGPLYYLSGLFVPIFHSIFTNLVVHYGLNIFFGLMGLCCFYKFLNLYFENRINIALLVVIVLVLLYQKPGLEIVPFYLCFLAFPVILQKDQREVSRYLAIGVVSFILASLSLSKFSYFYLAVIFVLILALFFVFRKHYFASFLTVGSFLLFLISLWMVTGQNLGALLPYIRSSSILANGYSEAMMLDFSEPRFAQIFTLALIFDGLILFILAYLIFTKQIIWAVAWLLPSVVVFLIFKQAFVRADGHVLSFLRTFPLASLSFIYLIRINSSGPDELLIKWQEKLSKSFFPVVAVILICAISWTTLNLAPIFSYTSSVISSLSIPDKQRTREKIRDAYKLDPVFLSQINKNQGIDIIPWDISLLYGYDLHWLPRPVIQTYAAFTSQLDDLNSTFFASSEAPEQLLFSLSTIDLRYSLYDMPDTFLSILDRYKYVSASEDGVYALLIKNPQYVARSPILIDEGTYKLGEDIPIHQVSGEHVFMSAEIQPTILGRILNIVYKSSPLFVEIINSSNVVMRHRFIRSLGYNPIFVSKYVQDLDDLKEVMSESYQPDIKYLRFSANTWNYLDKIHVRFYSVPFRK